MTIAVFLFSKILSYYNEDFCLSLTETTTTITIPLIIYVIFSMIIKSIFTYY